MHPQRVMVKKLTKIEVINRANEIHGYKYIYDKMDFVDTKSKVCIVCPDHGEFWQTPKDHLTGRGCPRCAYYYKGQKKANTKEGFIEKATEIHGNKYDYSKVEYVNNRTKVCIICSDHGEFWQTPANHLRGQGCPSCGREERKKKRSKTTLQFIKDAQQIHKNKFSYKKVEYVNNLTKVCITCPEHGDFWQRPADHLNGCKCPECAKKEGGEKGRLTLEEFKEKAIEVHKGKYNYDNVEYVNYDTKIKIICPTHGEFWQSPDAHLQGAGCQKCAYVLSKAEDDINSFINNECSIKTITKDRSLLGKKLECDILVPSHELGIEFNGLRWHSEQFNKDKNYHLHKTELAESKGYHLIHIFEDEWLEHKDLVLNKIKHILECDKDNIVVGARNCIIKTINKFEAETFLNTYHIQGFAPATVYYGGFYDGKLVSVMTFKQEKKDIWNLIRFATVTNYRLPGLASKTFKQFINDNNPIEVKTFLDRRWSHCTSNLYNKIGFELEKTLPPDYRYVVKNQRIHKFNFRKEILHKKYGLPLTMTEKEMTEKLGFYRIWDCGLYKYVWKR